MSHLESATQAQICSGQRRKKSDAVTYLVADKIPRYVRMALKTAETGLCDWCSTVKDCSASGRLSLRVE